ncbi:hypothetical protein J27TS7_14220 [Paenibacillus dendritiformis]|nr:hypothetical protein J27TS7_14220 [Paenibacillus dendritiformis]
MPLTALHFCMIPSIYASSGNVRAAHRALCGTFHIRASSGGVRGAYFGRNKRTRAPPGDPKRRGTPFHAQ